MYDEDKAVEYINEALKRDLDVTYDPDELLNVIDIIFDYYEKSGQLDIDNDDDLDVDDMLKYIRKTLASDSASPINPEHVEPIVMAEIDYENSIDDEE